MTHKQEILNFVLIGAILAGLISVFGGMLYIFDIVFFPSPIVRLTSPVVLLTPEVQSGEAVGWTFSYCKSADVSANLRLSLISPSEDGKSVVTVPLHYMIGALPQGCATATSWVEVPQVTPPGSYFLRVDHEYWSNSLMMQRFRYDTPRFTVLPKAR